MQIRRLDRETVTKLAAGEVVERPASVVRELVDNAIDSGATSVAIDIENGGLNLIRVVDNGRGMSEHDLAVCAQPHCTSKLTSLPELPNLASLGYRGEALHSISVMSRMRIVSRTPDAPQGSAISFEGNRCLGQQTQGCPEGTRVEVRDLFFNTPARLKFLKGAMAESTRIEQAVRRFVLGYPYIAFKLRIEGREQLSSSGSGSALDALIAVYGLRVAESVIEVRGESDAAKVEGYVSLPSISRSNRSDMHTFVNGRWIQNRSLLFAIQEAYTSLLMTGRFPIALLKITVPGDSLDINVHPQKLEVRFADERGVARCVGRAVRNELASSAIPQQEGSVATPQLRIGGMQGGLSGVNSFSATPSVEVRADDTEHSPNTTSASGEDPGLDSLRILGQLAGSYIIAEGTEGMCLIDQHAAHERVLLERFQHMARGGTAQIQSLLEPVVVPLTPVQALHARELTAELAALGFGVESFGEDTLLVRAVPAGLPPSEVAALVEELAGGIEGLADAEERRNAWLASLACHSAVRAGQPMSPAEMRQLLDDLARTRIPTACAHGRPTILELSKNDLDREFGRRGFRIA